MKLQINGDTGPTDTVDVEVSFPEADAGNDRTIPSFYAASDEPIALDGTGSTGADSYEWELVTQPGSSSASLEKRFTATPEFRPDLDGDYVFKLTINGESSKYVSEDEVTITVTEVK